MEFEDALFGWAKAQAAITANVGVTPTRFYKLKNPQGTKFPSLVMQRGGTLEQELYCGSDGTKRITLRVDAYGKTWAEMAATAKAFRDTLKAAFQFGPIMMGDGDSPADGVRVKSATMDNQVDLDDPSPGLFRRSQLWSFWIFEP